MIHRFCKICVFILSEKYYIFKKNTANRRVLMVDELLNFGGKEKKLFCKNCRKITDMYL